MRNLSAELMDRVTREICEQMEDCVKQAMQARRWLILSGVSASLLDEEIQKTSIREINRLDKMSKDEIIAEQIKEIKK